MRDVHAQHLADLMSSGLCGECFGGYAPDEWPEITCNCK